MKLTHMSFVSSPAGGASSGPKMLSKSAIEGFLPSASVDTSETQTVTNQRPLLSLHKEIKHGGWMDK